LSIDEDQSATTGGDEQDEYGKRVTTATKWGTGALLLVYAGLGAYSLIFTAGSAGGGHPEGVTRSVAVALGNSAVRSGSTAPRVPAPVTATMLGRLADAKAASAAAGSLAADALWSATRNEVLMAVSATAIGPNGSSDGDHPELASFAIDRVSAMSWKTHWYDTADFGNLQDGTGLLLDMGRTVTIRQIELELAGSPGFWGANLQIRIGDSPDLAGVAPVMQARDVGGWVTARLHSPATGRYVQIWFTRLPLDAQGTYQEHVYGITVHGSPRPSSPPARWPGAHTRGHSSHSGHASQPSHGSQPGQSRDGHSWGGYAAHNAYGGASHGGEAVHVTGDRTGGHNGGHGGGDQHVTGTHAGGHNGGHGGHGGDGHR
jgi:hypothetical protein